jgi:hypothetical protein
MRCELVTPRSSSWGACLSQVRHDFYHLPEYAELSAESHRDALARAFIARDDNDVFLVPLILRPIEGREERYALVDATGPYGYGSPIASTTSVAFMGRAIEAMIELLRQEHVVTLFSRLHPLLSIPLEPLRRYGTVVDHGVTVYCDLRRSAEELRNETRHSLRRRIQKARNSGLVAEHDRAWNHLDAFYEAYTQTMRRVGASEFYYFDRPYFARLRAKLHRNLHLLVVRAGNEVASAGIFSETCGIVQYHLSGTGDAFRHRDASHLLTHFAGEWARDRGNEVFHLGGGVGAAEDSLFRFKAGYSKQRSQFSTWRLVVNHESYRKLLESRQIAVDCGPAEASKFFPEYRAQSSVG